MTVSEHTRKLLVGSALLTAVASGILGPPITYLVQRISPQPEWQSVEVFADHYQPIQSLPIWSGFLLLAGFVLFITASYQLAGPEMRARALAGVVFAGIFGALAGFNYMAQAAFIPNNIGSPDRVLEVLTLHNPNSLAWAIEMFSYGFLGAATWCVAAVYHPDGRQGIIRKLLVLNGVMGILGAVVSAIKLSWVLTIPGLISYAVWNLTILITMIIVAVEFWRPAKHL